MLSSTLTFATFNVRGLSKELKQQQLGIDCNRYRADIVGLQETKTTVEEEKILPSKHKLVLFEQKNSRHGGLGFVINQNTIPYIDTWSRISDRVAILDLKLPSKGGTPTHCRVINAYGPTSKKAEKKPTLVVNFYKELSKAIDVPSRYEIFVLGDFNSKLGKNTDTSSENIGMHGEGTQNANGESLLTFMALHVLFACNTAFQHPCRHITTHTGWIKDYSAGSNVKVTKPIYTQLDYVLCRIRTKPMLRDARSYGGAITFSDHKIVCAKFQFPHRYLVYKTKNQVVKRYDCANLVANNSVKKKYQESVTKNIQNSNFPVNGKEKLNKIFEQIQKSADTEVGEIPPNKKQHFTSDPEIIRLVSEKQKLRLLLNNNESSDRTNLRTKINRLQYEIKKRLKKIKSDKAEHMSEVITNTDETRKMFEAVRTLTNSKPKSGITVHDNKGQCIGTDEKKADAIKTWFEEQFTGIDPPLEPFEGPARPLDVPITTEEVELAARSLKNGRATGPDSIPNELLKYASTSFYKEYANIINSCFTSNTYIDAVGEGILTPLQKPKKTPGPMKSLRPLTLLNGARKILSMLTLKRIQVQINNYTGPWQCAYKAGHSCANIVWSQRMLISVVMQKHWDFHKMGIDMSSAFDTIKRQTILNLLADCGCTEDEMRLVRFLLSNTKLKVRVNNTLSAPFESTLGSFQGDSLSGCLFTLTLAGALYHLRAVLTRPNPPFSDLSLPLEWEYADDVDFLDEEKIPVDNILPVSNVIMREWNLFTNEDKTEYTHVYLSATGEVGDDGLPMKDREEWRTRKSLGSLLCSSKDIIARCISGNIAFHKFKKVWLQGQKIPLDKKLMIYDAQVVSVILYNCNSWSASKDIIKKLDICHRKHLRRILNIHWPEGTISNETLYKRCKCTPLSERVTKSRWTMFGHILRSPENSPAFLALHFAIEGANKYKGRIGRHRVNLLETLQKDLKERNLQLRNGKDLLQLRDIARNRTNWRSLFCVRD